MATWVTGKGNYNAMCQVCWFKKKASDLRLRWDGLYVCEEDWEPRNILDFYRPRLDVYPLPFSIPDDKEGRTLQGAGVNNQGVQQMMLTGYMVGGKMFG